MKWNELKKDITSISDEEKRILEVTALLASVRQEKRMTQQELAAITKLTQAQIARAENSSYTPSLKTITKIAEGLGLEIAFIVKNSKELIRQ